MNTLNQSSVNQVKQPISTVEIFKGSQNLYYTLAGVNYDFRFPLEFAIAHVMDHGGLCKSCLTDGFTNGVFIGYCANCVDVKYGLAKGKGNGMLPGCIERCGWIDGSYYDPTDSIWETYLKPNQLTRDGIGCESLCEIMTYIPTVESIQHDALQQAIETGRISVRDRLHNSAMLCGNN
jgi:hypothetical protein